MEARAARFDEEDQLKKLRTQKVQERNAKLNALNNTNRNGPKEPACWGMCPEFEMIDRQVTNDVSLFEAQIPFNPPQGKLIIDPQRAVKKFRRSAAGNYELSEDLRPPEVLLATTVYLMRDVLGDQRWPANNVPFAVIYAFIRDRLRAIRTDLTLQNCKNLSSIRIHELTIRFLIASGHLLCEEERAAFEPQQNNEQLNGCLSALREMYKTVRLTQPANFPILLKYEAEFQAYSIILSVDKKEAAVAISSLPVDLLKNESIQVALEAYSAFQQTNYIKFLNLIGNDRRTSYLQASLLHQFVLPVRQRGLTAMVSVGADTYKTIPKSDFIRWFNFVDEDELVYYSDRFGFRILNDFIDLSSLINRGEAFDMKAEEENFKIRKFQVLIEDQRRGGAGGMSLSAKMFESMDLDVEQVMKVLENGGGGNKLKLTSEFLAASSSSPLPKQRESTTIKKFFTSKLSASQEHDNKPTAPTPDVNNMSFNFSQETTNNPSMSAPVITAPPVAPVVVDHQAVLRKKLEAQAQERQARKERISAISEGMLEALIDSIIGFQVSESCTLAWENLYQDKKENRKNLIENLSKKIFEEILILEILPKVLDVELMRIRCKAAESLTTKSFALNQVTFLILSEIEREIYEEIVLESFLNYKAIKFYKKVWFNKIKRCPLMNCFDIKNFNIPSYPIHLLFINNNTKLLEPLMKSKPPNTLGHLQTFLKQTQSSIRMLCSFDNFIISHMMEQKLNLFDWPLNYPGPTVIITTHEDTITVNTNEFPWKPEIINVSSESNLFEIFDFILKKAEFVKLPNLNQNISISQFITEELLESFVIEPYEQRQSFDPNESLLYDLIKGLIERIIWILFKSPNASRLLSWHPLTSGRSVVIESLRKSQNIPETFLNLFKASKSFTVTLKSIDQIYGNIFTVNLENLYTNQSISEIIISQNQIISTSRKRIKVDNDLCTDERVNSHSIDGLKEKLRIENLESEAYEQFLKKFL